MVGNHSPQKGREGSAARLARSGVQDKRAGRPRSLEPGS